MILYAPLALCAAGAIALVYRYDLYDREPPVLLSFAVGLAALLMFLAGTIESWALGALGVSSPPAIAWIAAVTEETLKLIAVLTVAGTARREFNDPMDGLIYGSMAGLGMALEESVAYLRAGMTAPGPQVLPPGEVVRLCGHLVMGGIGGFGVGMAALRKRGWPAALCGGWLAAIGLHFGWDWIALRAESASGFAPVHAASAALLMLAGFLLYGALVSLASRWSHDLFAPDLPARLWGWPFNRLRRG